MKSSPRPKYGLIVGLTLLCFALLWQSVLGQKFLALSEDFSYKANLNSVDNFYNETTQEYSGPQYSSGTFSYEVQSKTDQGLKIKNDFSVTTTGGDPIISVEKIYGIDPVTSEHVKGLGDEDREGTLFAPHNLKKGESFTYWHVNYDGPATMNYVDESVLYGLTVYHYESFYKDVDIDQSKYLDYLPDVPEKRGIKVKPHLELWIEPTTGYMVEYKDDSIAYYYDVANKQLIYPWNHFTNTFTDESVKEQVGIAGALRIKSLIIGQAIPGLLGLLGLCILLYAAFHKRIKEKTGGVDWAIILFVLIVPIVGMIITWSVLKNSLNSGIVSTFEARTHDIESTITKRLEIYTITLEGVRGLFAASDHVTNNEWQTYVNELKLEKNYPGVQAVGLARVVSEKDKETFLTEARTDSASASYTIFPEEGQDPYVVILYVSPEGENLKGLGFDMSSEIERKTALDQARDTGGSSMTGKLTLLVENSTDVQVGFIIYVPLFKAGAPVDTVAERTDALYGYATAAFRSGDFFNSMFGNTHIGVNMDLYDGTVVNPSSLIYSYNKEDTGTAQKILTKTETLYINGHAWTFQFTGLDEFSLNSSQEKILQIFLLSGIIVDVLFIFIFYALMVSREKALEYIEKKHL